MSYFKNKELLLAVLSGVFLAVGFFGARVFDAPQTLVLVFYAGAFLAGGFNTARHGVAAALHLRFDIDFLMVLAAVGAALLGEYAEGALLLFLFSLGHALEHVAMERARSQISALGDLTPRSARLFKDDVEQDLPVEDIEPGMTVVVRSGARIPFDGVILDGRGAVDEVSVTGESVPADKGPGDGVFAGTVNGSSTFRVEVTRLAEDTTLARVIKMVEEAESQQSPSQRFAERFTRVFVPVVLAVVALTIVVPPIFGLLTFSEAVLRGLSVLVAASPCALAIATPAAVLSGVARAARSGILIKGGVHLENLGSLSAIAFDKTGTITSGRFEVTDVRTVDGVDESELLRAGAAVEAGSTHPLARAVREYAEIRNRAGETATAIETIGGKGVSGMVNGSRVRVGNRALFAQNDVPDAMDRLVHELETQGNTCMMVEKDEMYLGVIALRDLPRAEAGPAVDALRRLGVRHGVLLTGDNGAVASSVAREVGLDDIRPELMPDEKVAAVRDLEREYGPVAMVGDGVNDAPALATATVGIAMGAGGTDVALESADVALMADDIAKLRFAVQLSRRSRRVIGQNLAISLGVMVLLVVTALSGITSIGPAIVAHEGSTLLVVANALRLLGVREEL